MVRSWFIHKILAEHKRRGLHSSRPVTRYIPGGKTRAVLPGGKPRHLIRITPLLLCSMKPPSDMDSESPTCRTDSLAGTLGQKTPEDASSPASSSESNAKELGQDTPFVPTVTAISSTPDFQWMVQPTIITSASPSLGNKQANEPQSSNKATPKTGGNKGKTAVRKGKAEQLSPEEEEKKRIRRERNKMAAAKCRNRRRELTDTLQAVSKH